MHYFPHADEHDRSKAATRPVNDLISGAFGNPLALRTRAFVFSSTQWRAGPADPRSDPVCMIRSVSDAASNSHPVATFNGRTNIPLASGEGSGGRDHSLLRPF